MYNHKGSFEGWVRRIAVNLSLDEIRKQSKLNFVNTEVPDVESEEDFLIDMDNYSDEKELVFNALNQLPDGYRTILNLSILEGYKHTEISEMLDITEGTSRSQLFWAKKKLKEILMESYEKRQKTHRSSSSR